MQKNIFYEEAARVPMLLRWPGVIPNGLVSDACLNTPDLMPTLLSLAGVSIPETVEGMDLSHCVCGKPGPEPEAAFLQGMGPSVDWDDGFEWRALRDKRYTYARFRAGGQEELYDNAADPLQLINLVNAPEEEENLARLRRQLNARMTDLNDSFKPITWYRDNWIQNGRIQRGARENPGEANA